MAKRIDPLKAKEARQRKLAIGLGVVFVAVLALQGPRTLKMLSSSGGTVAAPATTPAPTTPTPTPGTPVPAAGAQAATEDAVLADSDPPPSAGPGQLLTFETFSSKDPFAQQVDAAIPNAGAGPSESNQAELEVESAAGAGSPQPTTPATTTPDGEDAASTGGPSAPSATAPAVPFAPAAPPATATSISVNGTPANVSEDEAFPPDDPVFVLASTAADGKSVQIGIAGGSYASGKDTIKLGLGKPLILQNTADGSRYKLELLTAAGFVAPKRKQ